MGARRIVEKPAKTAGRRAGKKAATSGPRVVMPAWLGRRLLGGLLLVGGAGTVLGLGIWHLAQPDTLPIQRVQVEGEFRHLVRQDVYAAIGEPASGGFFNVDVGAVKAAAEAMPWVDSASVWRVWPDTLRVAITEQVPLARWEPMEAGTATGGGMVNMRGVLFHPGHGGDEGLPLFSGPRGSVESVAARYQSLSGVLAAAGLRVTALKLNQRRAWELWLDNGIRLKLGRGAGDERVQRFVDAYVPLLTQKAAQMKWVDLRYTNGFAVRWKQAPQDAVERTG